MFKHGIKWQEEEKTKQTKQKNEKNTKKPAEEA